MADYCSSTDVKGQLVETLGSSTDMSYDDLIASLITSASRAIDGYLGVQDNYFYPSTDEETRYYDGRNQQELEIDDFVSISVLGVAENGGVSSGDYVTWSSTDFFYFPYNAPAKGKPYKKLIVDLENGTKGYFPAFRKSVKVTGIFGYSATPPAPVKQACMAMVIRYMQRAKNAYQDAGANSSIGELYYVKELDPDVKTMLWKYIAENL